MEHKNKKQWHNILLLLLYVVVVTVSIIYAVSYFMHNSTERGLLAFERFSEQITYRVSDHLSKYTEQMILLKSELVDRQITDLDEIQQIFRRYIDNSALEGIGFVLNDGTARSYTGEMEVFDEAIDVLDVHNYPYTVTLSQNAVNGESQLLFRILWEGQGDPSAVAIYSYLPFSTISDLLKDTTYGDAGAFVAVVDHTGDHLWNSSDTLENKEGHNLIRDLEVYDLNDGAAAQEVATRLELQLSGLVTYTAYGEDRVLFYEPMGYNYWTLLTITPRSSVLNTENEIKMILVLTAGILAIVVAAVWFIYKNRKMQLALDVAQKESVFKGKFLSNVSHEIRTPLNGISGILHLMKNSGQDAVKQGEYLLRMEASVQQLTDIVNDVLDMAKIESGSVDIRSERFDLIELSEKTSHLFDAAVQEKGIELNVDLSGLKQRFFVGDAKKIQQIMTNLLSNAVKFTDRGSVTLSLSEDQGGICILVSDTGCGMKNEFQEIIFQPFTQEDTTYGRTQTGTGLGMAIISELVQVLHGTISVWSQPEKGSSFTVLLPLQADDDQSRQKEQPEEQPVSLDGIHILMAEDNAINSMIVEELLTQAGVEVKTVENGQLAVNYFLGPDSGHVDMILMDIRMPVMDGLEAARRIRASDHPRAKSIPILALTANGLEEDNKEILDAGMNQRLSKPISVQQLYESIQFYVSKENEG
ncbi:Autoinducer 2 sensor kinase/phosphatase LuxQ [Blautia producta]|uniref:Circadian input-output histidine kinase CikA n=1 Tax=Blautia producta TaxID=33035 RepID=A0A4V0Z7Z3_9FIRM|nr:ATP-binding protein [Blautia producta]QBE98498.1 Autoinducer 2 sensor kinase/phosphatase LuxQ [Blautia producta]